MTHAGGLTNLEKERKKNFLMVRKGKSAVKGKTRLGDKQVIDPHDACVVYQRERGVFLVQVLS